MTSSRPYYKEALARLTSKGQRRFRFVSDVPDLYLTRQIDALNAAEESMLKCPDLAALITLAEVVAETMVICGVNAQDFTAKTSAPLADISKNLDAFVSELGLGIPCHKRTTLYANNTLQAIMRSLCQASIK